MSANPESCHACPCDETPREYLRRLARSLSCFVVLALGLLSILAVGSLPSCQAVAPTYDGQVIAATTRLAADADALLAQATQPFDRHDVEVAGMRTRLATMIKAAKARGRGNVGVVAQWELIAQPRAKGGELLGALLDEWETNSVLENPMLKHRRAIVREAFRAIVSTEVDRPPGLQARLAMEAVLGTDDPPLPEDSGALDTGLFPEVLPEGNIAIP
jgi:hypothetical protein